MDRTKTGLLLLIWGLPIGAFPFVGFIGGILNIAGAIMVVLGRDAFGYKHSRNTVFSLVLYIIGFIILLVAAGAFASTVQVAASNLSAGGAFNPAPITDAFNGLLETSIVTSVLTGLGFVLFTYALQKRSGKLLLWAGFGASVVIEVFVALVIGPLVTGAVVTAFEQRSPAPITSIMSELQALRLLDLIPAIIYAVAYYMARQRVEWGELPERQTSRLAIPAKY